MFWNEAGRDRLVECFQLYRNQYQQFTGFDEDIGKRIIGCYNLGKINPKEPDLRLYYVGERGRVEEREFLAFWLKKSKRGRPYLIGNKNGLCYIGIIHINRFSEDDPYMTIYLVMKTTNNKECIS